MTLNGTSSWNLRCSNWLKTTRRKVCNKNINSFGLVKRIKSAATIFSSEVFIYTERRVSFSICLVSRTLLINRGQLLRKWFITKACIFIITIMTYQFSLKRFDSIFGRTFVTLLSVNMVRTVILIIWTSPWSIIMSNQTDIVIKYGSIRTKVKIKTFIAFVQLTT